jgi:hypothetical protein
LEVERISGVFVGLRGTARNGEEQRGQNWNFWIFSPTSLQVAVRQAVEAGVRGAKCEMDRELSFWGHFMALGG